jgi:hypothetical protein
MSSIGEMVDKFLISQLNEKKRNEKKFDKLVNERICNDLATEN